MVHPVHGPIPFIAPCKAQKLSKTRNSVVETDVMDLFNTLVKLTIELKLQPSQIVNMDEAAFMTRSKSKHAIAVRGSSKLRQQRAFKTVTVAGQLLTCELLDEMAAKQLSRVAKKKKTNEPIAAMTVAQSFGMEAFV
jgi:hypothetical protein